MNPLWEQLAAAAGLTFTPSQQEQLSKYIDLLLEANRLMNLTRIDERPAAEVLHVGDAMTLLPHLPREAHWLADVGSGGGVPGIPLAIARPDAQVTLIESTLKKADFLTRAVDRLGLKNVRVVGERAETVGRGALRESFDVAVARALGALSLVAEWCLPLVKIGGKVLAIKGERVTEELPAGERAARLLGGGGVVIHPVKLPGVEHHVIAEIGKIAATERRYPRPPGVAKKKPL